MRDLRDLTGREIKIGHKVVAAASYATNSTLLVGTVVDVTDGSCRFEITAFGHNPSGSYSFPYKLGDEARTYVSHRILVI